MQSRVFAWEVEQVLESALTDDYLCQKNTESHVWWYDHARCFEETDEYKISEKHPFFLEYLHSELLARYELNILHCRHDRSSGGRLRLETYLLVRRFRILPCASSLSFSAFATESGD